MIRILAPILIIFALLAQVPAFAGLSLLHGPALPASYRPALRIADESEAALSDLQTMASRVQALGDENTVFIAIGASPLAIAAGIEAAAGRVVNLPLSSVRTLRMEEFAVAGGNFLFLYLDYFLAKHLSAERFVLFDYAQSGESMQSTRGLLSAYFALHGIERSRLQFVALAYENRRALRSSADLVLQMPKDLGAAVAGRHFQYLRRYSKVTLGQWQKWLKSRTPGDPVTFRMNVAAELQNTKSAEGEAKYAEAVELFHRRAPLKNKWQRFCEAALKSVH